MKKKILVVILIFLIAVLLIPIKYYYKDGGTVAYRAILYSVTNYHSISPEGGYYTGIEVKILGKSIYDSTTFDN